MPDPTDEALWHEKLCRELGVNSGPILDTKEARDAGHALLSALSSPFEYGNNPAEHQREVERLGAELKAAQRCVEDAHAARLGLPPRPR